MSDQAAAAAEPALAWPVKDVLRCPLCGTGLEGGGGDGLRCAACGSDWPERQGWLDFRPPEFAAQGGDWDRRQSGMEDWYARLLEAPEQAVGCFRHDFEPLAPQLAELRGLVVDVGGGNGIARLYLERASAYICVDPSPRWLQSDWLGVAGVLPALADAISFVLAVGEQLPLRSGLADAVLVLFSVNHAADPRRVIAEAERVLKPGGRLLLTAEDTEPRWRDLGDPGYRAGYVPLRRALRDKLAASLGRRPWPTAPDHVRVTEEELSGWIARGFELRRRSWSAGYLLLDAVKRDA